VSNQQFIDKHDHCYEPDRIGNMEKITNNYTETYYVGDNV